MDGRTENQSPKIRRIAASAWPYLAFALAIGLASAAANRSDISSEDAPGESLPRMRGFASLFPLPSPAFATSAGSILTSAQAQPAQASEAMIVQALQVLLADSSTSVREAAADALGARVATSAVPALIAAMADPQRRVRLEAADALGEIGDPSAVTALGQALSDTSRDVAEAAAQALGNIQSAQSADLLENALLLPRDERFRQTLIQSLGRTGQPGAVEVLEGFLPLADRRLQETILESLAESGSGAALGAVLRTAESADPNLRLLATRALGEP